MKMAEELQRELRSINRKSYPAYKGLKGAYQFPDYQLFIEHVQGDPFAAPSALRIFVPHSKAKFPERYYWDKCSKVALQDALLRRFAEISAKFCYQAKGSGKSGVIQVSHCGQEVLERTACEITKEGIHIRFFVGFPANGRTINSGELEKILFVYLPKVRGNVSVSQKSSGKRDRAGDLFKRGSEGNKGRIKEKRSDRICGKWFDSAKTERKF